LKVENYSVILQKEINLLIMLNRQRVLQAANTISNDAKTYPMTQSLILMQSKIGWQLDF